MDHCVVSVTFCVSELSQFKSNVGQVGSGFNLGETPEIGHFVPGLQTGWTTFRGKYPGIFVLEFQKENDIIDFIWLGSNCLVIAVF